MARRTRGLPRLKWWRRTGERPGTGAATRLVLDRVEGGHALGWAHGPPGAQLSVRLGEARLTHWPRDIDRPDADEAVGETATPKGFRVPVDPLRGLLALMPADERPPAAIDFAEQTVPITPAAPEATMTTLGGPVADMWLSDSAHLRLRTQGVRAVLAAQAGQPAVRATTRGEGPALVTLALADPLAPVLLVLETADGRLMDLVPFPSLLRGGMHRAETLATAGADAGLPARATTLARSMGRAMARDPSMPAAARSLAAARRQARSAGPADGAGREAGDHALPADSVPTLASLCGPARGVVVADPAPGGETWLVHPVSLPGLAAAMPAGDPPLPFAEPGAGGLLPPAAIVTRSRRDEGLDPLLFPLAPDAPFAQPQQTHVVVLPGGSAPAEPLHESLDRLPVTLVEAAGDLAELGGAGPVLFLDRAMLLTDPRTVAALQRMVAVSGVATASPMIVGEPRPGDRTTWDRVRSAGLFPTLAAADMPWRPAVGPLAVAPHLFRSAFIVAANPAACVMVGGEALAKHGADLPAAAPDSLGHLMARCTAAGLHHAATTWFSVFDRGALERPQPGPSFEALPPPAAVTLARRLA